MKTLFLILLMLPFYAMGASSPIIWGPGCAFNLYTGACIGGAGGTGTVTGVSGDVTGAGTGVIATSVVRLQGRDLASTAPTNGQVIAWNSTTSTWEPTTPSGGGGGANTTLSNLTSPTDINQSLLSSTHVDLGDNAGGHFTNLFMSNALADQTGSAVIDVGSRIYYSTDGTPAISMDSGGSFKVQGRIKDNVGVDSIDPSSRILFDSSGSSIRLSWSDPFSLKVGTDNGVGAGDQSPLKVYSTGSNTNVFSLIGPSGEGSFSMGTYGSAFGNGTFIQSSDFTTTTPLYLQRQGGGVRLGAAGGQGLLFPDVDGTSGQFLQTDGAGNLSFATVSGGGSSFIGVKAVEVNDIDVTNPGSDTFDGVTLVSGDYLLLIAQSDDIENGVWQFDTSSTPLVRPSVWTGLKTSGTIVAARQGGTTLGKTLWVLNANSTVDSDPELFHLSGFYPGFVPESLLPRTANTIDIGAEGIQWNSGYFTNIRFTDAGARVQLSTGRLAVGGGPGADRIDWTNYQLKDGTAVKMTWNGAIDTGVSVNSKISVNQNGTTSAAPEVGAGTGATCSVTSGTDTAGLLQITTGTTASAGNICLVTFATAFPSASYCTITPANANAADPAGTGGNAWFVIASSTDFEINFNGGAGSLTDATTYDFYYHCIGQ